jgi:hypothetical protein
MTLLDDVKNAAMKYAQLYNPIKKREKFDENENEHEQDISFFNNTITSILWLIVVVFAIYLSFKKNNNQFNLSGFLVAFFFAPIYIIYVVATTGLTVIYPCNTLTPAPTQKILIL